MLTTAVLLAAVAVPPNTQPAPAPSTPPAATKALDDYNKEQAASAPVAPKPTPASAPEVKKPEPKKRAKH